MWCHVLGRYVRMLKTNLMDAESSLHIYRVTSQNIATANLTTAERNSSVMNLHMKTKCFKVITVKTQRCINISILLWQHVSVLLDNFQASIQRYEVQSLHIMLCTDMHWLYLISLNAGLKIV